MMEKVIIFLGLKISVTNNDYVLQCKIDFSASKLSCVQKSFILPYVSDLEKMNTFVLGILFK